MKKLFYLGLAFALALSSCSDDDDDKWFGEDETSLGTILTLEGGTGGASAINAVYVDFSEEAQQSVERTSWHLGFNCTSSFGVVLNNTLGSRAIEAAEGVTIATVISEDDNTKNKASLGLGMGTGTWSLVDAYDGDLTKTVIKEDKVYIYDSGEAGLELYKVSVSKKDANTYTLTYALWNEAIVKSINITKNADYNTIGVSLILGNIVTIQPEKKAWDMVWGRSIYTSPMNPDMPFIMADIIFVNNKNGVQTAQILINEENKNAYENYDEEDVASTEFSSDVDIIGSKWRVTKVDTSVSPAVSKVLAATDRFFVIKDTDGNIYKLRFISVSGDDGGERGKPEVEYALVQTAK